MAGLTFTKATKKKAKLRLALIGPSGSGKTWTALKIATEFGGKIAVIDTEHGSASKYAGTFQFDVLDLDDPSVEQYVAAIHAAEDAGYDFIIVDSMTHAWQWAIDEADRVATAQRGGNSFTAWAKVTPKWNQFLRAFVACKSHIIGTARSKTEYVIEQNERGKSAPKKVGMGAVLRDGAEYEFDVVGEMDLQNNLVVSKTRCSKLNGAVIAKPGKQVADTLKAWLEDGAEPPPPPEPTPIEKLKLLLKEKVGCKTLEDANLTVRWAVMDLRSSAPKYASLEAVNTPEAAQEVYDALVSTDAAPGGEVKFKDMLKQARQLALENSKEGN